MICVAYVCPIKRNALMIFKNLPIGTRLLFDSAESAIENRSDRFHMTIIGQKKVFCDGGGGWSTQVDALTENGIVIGFDGETQVGICWHLANL